MENDNKTIQPMSDDALEEDRRLVERLLAGEESAWEHFCVDIVAPMLKWRRCREMLQKYSLPLDSVVGQVYLDLTEDDCSRLRKYCFKGPLGAWLWRGPLREAVKKLIRQQRGLIDLVLPDDEQAVALTEGVVDADAGERAMSSEVREELNRAFVQLWEKSPMKAIVFFMRVKEGLEANDVAPILAITRGNVDTMNKRGKEEMARIIKENKK